MINKFLSQIKSKLPAKLQEKLGGVDDVEDGYEDEAFDDDIDAVLGEELDEDIDLDNLDELENEQEDDEAQSLVDKLKNKLVALKNKGKKGPTIKKNKKSAGSASDEDATDPNVQVDLDKLERELKSLDNDIDSDVREDRLLGDEALDDEDELLGEDAQDDEEELSDEELKKQKKKKIIQAIIGLALAYAVADEFFLKEEITPEQPKVVRPVVKKSKPATAAPKVAEPTPVTPTQAPSQQPNVLEAPKVEEINEPVVENTPTKVIPPPVVTEQAELTQEPQEVEKIEEVKEAQATQETEEIEEIEEPEVTQEVDDAEEPEVTQEVDDVEEPEVAQESEETEEVEVDQESEKNNITQDNSIDDTQGVTGQVRSSENALVNPNQRLSGDEMYDSADTPADPITEEILKNLEQQINQKMDKREETLTKQKPAQFNIVGRGLVYSCTGKHWACVDAANYLRCENNFKYFRFNGLNPECFPEQVYASDVDCARAQQRMVDYSINAKFCN